MKKALLIATLFAVAGFANAQNTAAAPGAPATQTAGDTAKPAQAPTMAPKHHKKHATKHVRHASKKSAKTAGAEPVTKTDASTPAK